MNDGLLDSVEKTVGGFCWFLMATLRSSTMGIDQLAVHSLTAIDGFEILFRKYLPTVVKRLVRISCFCCCFSVAGRGISICLLAKIVVLDLYHSLIVLIVADLKKELVECEHSHIQWYIESERGQLLHVSDRLASCCFIFLA